MQGYRFANTTSAENADCFASLHVEADVIQHPICAEGLAHVPKVDIRSEFCFVRHIESAISRSASRLPAFSLRGDLRGPPIFRRVEIAKHFQRKAPLAQFLLLNRKHLYATEQRIDLVLPFP